MLLLLELGKHSLYRKERLRVGRLEVLAVRLARLALGWSVAAPGREMEYCTTLLRAICYLVGQVTNLGVAKGEANLKGCCGDDVQPSNKVAQNASKMIEPIKIYCSS